MVVTDLVTLVCRGMLAGFAFGELLVSFSLCFGVCRGVRFGVRLGVFVGSCGVGGSFYVCESLFMLSMLVISAST